MLVLLSLCATAAPAAANMGNPYTAGLPGGEPTGLEQVAVERETLEIDLRPLADGKSASIVATYAVRNDGAARVLPLVFVAAGLDERAPAAPAITLDSVAVRIAAVQPLPAPASWQPPPTTPGFGDGAALTYVVRQPSGLRFDLALTAGRHTIRAEYAAAPTKAALSNSPLVYWQLAYVLAPARQWASFGGLDVSVRVPPGWSAASSPPLARRGDVLSGTFGSLDADALALTVQAPIPPATSAAPVAIAIVLAATLAAWRVGGWLGRRRRSSRWALLFAFVAGIAWIVALVLAFGPPSVDVPGQNSYTYGYGTTMAIALGAPFVFAVGFAATQLVAYVASRRARRPEPSGSR